jgi:hypothetical protein
MDLKRRKEIRKRVHEEFELGRAHLFRPEIEQQVLAEMKEDRERLVAHFTQQVTVENLELLRCLKRFLLNFGKVASYRGILKGHQIFTQGLELAKDKAKFYLATEHLKKHPDASFQDMCAYLDRKNSRLIVLRTSKNSPLWAPIPPSWRKAIQKLGLDTPPGEGELWRTALERFPGRVEPYLSRARKLATDTRNVNILRVWPRIIREHRKRRKRRKGPTEQSPAGPERS